ncbi:VPLPA-CTERM sorting domain-containing protein [Roseobacter sp. A03A-229]
MQRILYSGAFAVFSLLPLTAQAVTIDVLWTSGVASHNAGISTLAANAGSFDPDGDGALDWNLTFWDGLSDPTFSNYDVLVIGSTCNTGGSGNCGGSNGFFGNGLTADGVLSYGDEIAAARGNRTFLSGQDADYHYLYDGSPGPLVDNGPKGFIINAVNWAASGTGLGIVSMTDRYLNNSGWWTADGSFLKDELGNAPFFLQMENVDIGPGQGGFPINEGLTDAGLSNWGTSSHACFDSVTGYTAINLAGSGINAGCGVTIVTARSAGGDTGGGDNPDVNVVPLPAGMWLMLAGLGGLGVLRRRKA